MRLKKFANLPLWNVMVAFVFVVLFFTSDVAEAATVGDCTPGQRECQISSIAECSCHDQWSDERGEMVLVCVWEQTDINCGTRPSCDESRDGREWRTEYGSYECDCSKDENGNARCEWESY